MACGAVIANGTTAAAAAPPRLPGGDALAHILSFCSLEDHFDTLPLVSRAFRDCVGIAPHAWPTALVLPRGLGLGLAGHLERARSRDTAAASACEAWRPDLRKLWRCVRSVTWRVADDTNFTALAALCPLLRRLEIHNSSYGSDAGLLAVAAACQHLESLRLWIRGTNATHDTVMALARSLPLLQELGLVLKVNDRLLAALAANCPRLRVFSIEHSEVTDDGWAAALARWPELERLKIGGFTQLTLASFRAIGASLPRLRAFASYVPFDPAGSDACVQAVAEGCRLLRELDLTGWDGITDAALLAVASRCPLLERLTLSGCTGLTHVGFAAVATECPRLAVLRASDCKLLTDESIVGGLVHCKELEELSFSFAGPSIAVVGAHCPRLRKVNVVSPYGDTVTDDVIASLARGCPGLQSLMLCNCSQLTDAGIIAVAANCPRLEELDVSRCTALTDESLLAVADNCPRLKRLYVSHCRALTVVGVATVVRSCTLLCELHATGFGHVSDALARCIVETPHALSNLAVLDLTNFDFFSSFTYQGPLVGRKIRSVLRNMFSSSNMAP
jgi:F-box/leucine-rich repeat protein 2/20